MHYHAVVTIAVWQAKRLTPAAVSLGIAALFIEVHPDPDKALSDRETQLPLAQVPALLERLAELDAWAKTAEPDSQL